MPGVNRDQLLRPAKLLKEFFRVRRQNFLVAIALENAGRRQTLFGYSPYLVVDPTEFGEETLADLPRAFDVPVIDIRHGHILLCGILVQPGKEATEVR